MGKQYALMNMLIKGPAASIKQALSMQEFSEYEIDYCTCDLSACTPNSQKIEQIGLIFVDYLDDYLTLNQIPFATMPDVKFIAMAHGGDEGCSEGTYAIFKDFYETKVSVCRRFTYATPAMEEFDCDYDPVIDQVMHSFLDHAWSFEYEDFSCGQSAKYAFGKKKDHELIARWEDDTSFE